jgi:hypothetical protein
VQSNADPEQVGRVYKHMDTHIDAAVRFGRIAKDENENQGDLPLKANGNGAAAEDRAEA